MILPSGLMENMDSFTRNPTAAVSVAWKDTLVSGEWFRLDQSLLDNEAFLTSITYTQYQTIVEIITDADAKLYNDESAYVKMLEGYSELLGDSFHYATSDLDFELDNTTNRFTPRKNENLLKNPGFENSKDNWSDVVSTSYLLDTFKSTSGEFRILSEWYYTSQSFNNNTARKLEKLSVFIKKKGIPEGNIVASIYAHTGTYGTSSLPTGAALATSSPINTSSLYTSMTEMSFAFLGANRITLSASTRYVIVISYTGTTNSGVSEIYLDAFVGNGHAGNSGYYDVYGHTWYANAGTDMSFSVYGVATNSGGVISIDNNVVNFGKRSLRLNNPTVETCFSYSDAITINRGEAIGTSTPFSLSAYVNGVGNYSLQIRSYGPSASGTTDANSYLLASSNYQSTAISGEWHLNGFTATVPSGAYYVRAILSSSGTLTMFDDVKLERNYQCTPIDTDFIGDMILPKKSVKASVGFNTDNINKFAGAIQKIIPSIKDDSVKIYCYDWTDIMKDKKVLATYYENIRTDQIIANLAIMAGLGSSKLNLEVGKLTITFAWLQDGSIWTYMNQVAEAEGGMIFFDEQGTLTFYNRDHFKNSADPVYGFSFGSNITDLSFEISKDKVKNRIEVKANPKKKLVGKTIYNLTDSQAISAGETAELWGQFNYGLETTVPALNVVVPIVGTGIMANSLADGTGTNKNSDITMTSYYIFQESIKVNIKNTSASTVYITKFDVVGDPIVIKTRIEVVAEDPNSQALYDTQILAIENDLMDSEEYANSLAIEKLAEMKDPMDAISIECVGAPFLRVGDIVSVQRSFDGTFENFQIIKNRWQFEGDFMQNLELQKKVGISNKIYYVGNFLLTENGESILLEDNDNLIY